MVVVSKRKATLEHLTARCVVLGDKQVGKSASIVRYTTGRFIQEYSKSTNDWLYRHSLGLDPKRNAMITLELLEQKDIQFCSTSNFFAISKNNSNNNNNNNSNNNNGQQQPSQLHQSLAYRVALDQQIDNEFHEKQQLLNKLHWADAYVVIYAVNDIYSFNKAIKYLNLIANTINSPLDNHKTQQSSSSSGGSGTSSTPSNGLTGNAGNSSSIGSNLNDLGASGGKLLNKLFPSIQNHHNSNSNSFSNSTGSISSTSGKIISPLNSHHNVMGSVFCNCSTSNGNIKRPILLLANKSDLGRTGRQVSVSDGRLLAMRHQSMFAEVSIAESNKLIESVISNLIEQIDPTCFHIDRINQQQQQIIAGNQFDQDRLRQKGPKIIQWLPNSELTTLNQTNQNGVVSVGPVWGSIVRSQAIGSNISVQGSFVTASKAIESDVRLITPLALRAKSVESKGSLIKPMTARTILSSREKLPESTQKVKSAVKGQSNQKPISNRYENLKSSFKRASMAIVSSKALAKGSHVAKVLKEGDIRMSKINPIAPTAPPDPITNTAKQVVRSSTNSIPETFECTPIVSKENRKSLEIVGNNKMNSPSTSSNWFKNQIRGLSRIDRAASSYSTSDPKLNCTPPTVAATTTTTTATIASVSNTSSVGGPLISDRLKRPLLKYKNRRKTVAFEQIGQGTIEGNTRIGPISKPATIEYLPPIDSCSNNYGPFKLLKKRRSDESRGSESYSSIQCSSGRSSSSLSTTDPYYSALFILWNKERAPSSSGSISLSNYSNNNNNYNQPKSYSERQNSKSTLSCASTSGGSHEDSGDELSPLPKSDSKSSIINKELSGSSLLADSSEGKEQSITAAYTLQNNNKKPYQLVKSVQSTLTNLSKSSNVSAQAAKRSFCNALFSKHSSQPLDASPSLQSSSSIPPMTAPAKVQTGAIIEVEPIRPIMNFARTENICTVPIVGYCN